MRLLLLILLLSGNLSTTLAAADACITPPFAVAVIEEKMQLKLRTLLETPSIPNLSIVVHSRLPSEQHLRLNNALLSWQQDNSEKALLNRMKTQGFVTAIDKEYDVVRTLLREIDRK